MTAVEWFDRDEVLARVDLVSLVEEYSGRPVRQVGARMEFHCPWPGHDDVHPSFHVDRRLGTPMFACRSQCQKYGTAIDLVMWLEGVDCREALRRLADRAGVPPTNRRTSPIRAAQPAPKPSAWTLPADTSTPMAEPKATEVLAQFCADRGVRVATALDLGLHLVTDPQGRSRVRFPFTVAGELVTWQDRAVGAGVAKEDRWRGPAGVGLVPFGVDRMVLLDDYARCVDHDDPQQDLWVVEGPTDGLALIDGCPEAVVIGLPGGAFPTLARWVAAASVGLDVFLVVDNDETGTTYRTQMTEACAEGGVGLHQVHVPADHNDVGEWRLAAGDRFREELVLATMATLEGEGR